MNDTEQQHSSENNLFARSDSEWNEWMPEAAIDELLRNLAAVEQTVTNDRGQRLVIRKYQSKCIRLAPLILIAEPVPEYLIYASDLKFEVVQALRNIHHPVLLGLVLRQAVLRLFESIGVEPYISISRRLIVKLIWD